MDSRQIRNLSEAYTEMYAPQETDWQEVYDSLLEMCMLDEDFESDTEREDFVEWIIAEGREEEFVEAIFEDYGIDLETLNEDLLDERAGALLRGGRAIINALSRAGRSKAGLNLGTALGRKPETVVQGAAASSSIRAARGARVPYTPPTGGRPLAAQQLRRSADVSGATKQLPGGGGTSAGSLKATTQRGTTRHNQAMGQLNTFAQGLKKMFRQSAAQTKLDTAARGTTGTGVRTGTTTPIRGQLSASKPVSSTSSGLIGTRNVPDMKAVSRKYGMDAPAPKPNFGPGATGGGKIPKPPVSPGKLTTTKPSALGSPDLSVKKVSVTDLGPTTRRLPSGSENLNVGRMARRAAVAGATAAVAGSAGSDASRDKTPATPKAPTATPEAPKTTPKAPEATAPTPPAAPTPEAPKKTPKAPEVKAPTVTTATPKRSAQTGDKKKDMKTWADANPRLAKVAALRKKGASRAEINMAMYDKGSKPYEAAKKKLGK